MVEPYTVTAAAALLHCSDYTVRELCRSGRLPGIKLGEDWIIPAGALFQRLDQIALEEAEKRRTPAPAKAISLKTKARPVLPSIQERQRNASAN